MSDLLWAKLFYLLSHLGHLIHGHYTFLEGTWLMLDSQSHVLAINEPEYCLLFWCLHSAQIRDILSSLKWLCNPLPQIHKIARLTLFMLLGGGYFTILELKI